MYRNMNSFNSIKITDNLNCYIWQGMGNNCNSILFNNVLNGGKSHLLIDPGHINNEFRENCFENLAKAMEKDGFSVADISLIANTHSHTDHCEANEFLSRDNNINITMSEAEEKFRHADGKKLDAMFGIKTPQFKTTSFLQEGTFDLDEGKIQLELLLAPGHSPGSICFYWPVKKILITGDVVFYGSVGRTDFPGCNGTALKNSIERLSHLDVEILIPGHSTEMGSVIEGKQNIERNFQAIGMYF
jgi:hydroxyacylglutathione hydrolase